MLRYNFFLLVPVKNKEGSDAKVCYRRSQSLPALDQCLKPLLKARSSANYGSSTSIKYLKEETLDDKQSETLSIDDLNVEGPERKNLTEKDNQSSSSSSSSADCCSDEDSKYFTQCIYDLDGDGLRGSL